MDGVTVSKLIRACGNEAPMSSDRFQELLQRIQDKIKGRANSIFCHVRPRHVRRSQESLVAGMDDYITKPFKPEMIFTVQGRHPNPGTRKPDNEQKETERRIREKSPVIIKEVREHLSSTYQMPLYQVETNGDLETGIKEQLEILKKGFTAWTKMRSNKKGPDGRLGKQPGF